MKARVINPKDMNVQDLIKLGIRYTFFKMLENPPVRKYGYSNDIFNSRLFGMFIGDEFKMGFNNIFIPIIELELIPYKSGIVYIYT